MVVRDVLDNGLRLITESMPHVRSVTIGVWLMRGSRHESDERSGIAHFVEHMLFKGTDTRSAEDIAQSIDSIGGQLDATDQFQLLQFVPHAGKAGTARVPSAEARSRFFMYRLPCWIVCYVRCDGCQKVTQRSTSVMMP